MIVGPRYNDEDPAVAAAFALSEDEHDEPQEEPMGDDLCPLSQRVDVPGHSWGFDGDDPYIRCHYCGELRDALTGHTITPGRTA